MTKARTAQSDSSRDAPGTVIWDVTRACNLSCPVCLAAPAPKGRRELDSQEAFRLIDSFSAAGVRRLTVTGGEPFVRGDIVELLSRLADAGLRVEVSSNGDRLSPAVFRALRRLRTVRVRVSLAGTAETHDCFRGRRGAFANAVRTIGRLADAGLPVGVRATVTAQNVECIGELVDLAFALGCDSFAAAPFIPSSRGARFERRLLLGRTGSLALNGIISRKNRELAGRMALSVRPCFLFLLNRPAAPAETEGETTCPAGCRELCVGADGTVYPCPSLRDFPLGRLPRDSIERIWRESPALAGLRALAKNNMHGPCRTCRYAPAHCRGGCRASAYLAWGDLNGSDPLCIKDIVAAAGAFVKRRPTAGSSPPRASAHKSSRRAPCAHAG